MAKDPEYVRLVDRMARSTQVDIRSGWSIAGLDVRDFPDSDHVLAQEYVRDAIRRGTIEGCSKAEYEEVNGGDHDYLSQTGVTVKPFEVEGHFQEAHVVGLAEERRHALEAARGLSSSGGNYSDDKVRRAAILRAQRAAEGEEKLDDDEDLQELSSGQGVNPDDVELGEGENEEEEQASTRSTTRRAPAKKAAAKKTTS